MKTLFRNSRITTRNRWQSVCSALRNTALLMSLICSMLPVGGNVHAAPWFEPSITASALADDNIFISAEDQQSDTILRLTPALETGYESNTVSTRAFYARDIESYAEYSELNSSNMRQLLELSMAYQPTAMTVYSVGASYLESRIPAEFNITTGVGLGRVHGDRFVLNPEVNHRFTETLKGVVAYSFIQENLADGIKSDTNLFSLGLEHDRSRTVQMTYEYNLAHYSFDNGIDETLHTPRIGIFHAIGEGTSVSGLIGPRFSRNGVDVDFAALIQHQYAGGRFQFGYDRTAGTLIGEPGLVDVDALNAGVFFSVSERLEASLVGNYGGVSRQDSSLSDARVYRAMLSANYQLNTHLSLTASYAYSRQHAPIGVDEERLVIPGNVVMLAITFRMPQRSERIRRDL